MELYLHTPSLTATPVAEAPLSMEAGLFPINLGTDRDGLVFIPKNATGPLPLLVVLHAAGGSARCMFPPFQEIANASKSVLLIPESREDRWDDLGNYGPDAKFINLALMKLFQDIRIDPAKIAVAGFAEGATFALALGIDNGNFFSHILAYSPYFMAPPFRRNCPAVYISHGTQDRVEKAVHNSRKLVPLLENNGIEVFYHEFKGGHVLSRECIQESLHWFLDSPLHYEEVPLTTERTPYLELPLS